MGNHSEWCFLDPSCIGEYSLSPSLSELAAHSSRSPAWEAFWEDSGGGVDTANITNSSCDIPLCVLVLSYTIGESKVRAYDVVLLIFSFLFLLYLVVRLVPTAKKLNGSLPLFKILFTMMFVIPLVSCTYEVISMIDGYYRIPSQILHIFLRGAILLTELSVVVFGIFFKYYNNQTKKLVVTLIVIFAIAAVFTVTEGVLEFFNPMELPCDDYKLFTHGGMIFLFSTSLAFACAYMATFGVYMVGLHRRWNLPSKKSFYRYALFLSLVNILQALGSVMWFASQKQPRVGSAGICLTVIANVIYITTYAPIIYWIFLSNYFRMNREFRAAGSQINVSSGDTSSIKKKRTSNPLHIAKKGTYFGDHTSLITESFGSESSYGSLNDEESFMKRELLQSPNV